MRTVTQKWKALAMAAFVAIGLGYSVDAAADASLKNVICLKTNTGNYFPVVRVSAMVAVDGSEKFEIVLKDGQGEANVTSVSFEKHEEMIDFDRYKTNADGTPYIDMSKPSWMITSTGKYFKVVNVKTLEAQAGTTLYNVVTTTATEPNVKNVYFTRASDDEIGTVSVRATRDNATEKLRLMTPVSSSLSISGCGDATVAYVYGMDGQLVGQAPVYGGNANLSVRHLNSGMYIVRVGNKSLKFLKKN